MRLFVAIDVGGPTRGGGTAPTHLTLRFLGEVPPGRLDAIVAAIDEAVTATPPFDLTLDGVGAFPSSDRPRVVWVGAAEGGPATVALADRVAAALEGAGFPRERDPFVPHVTLFRVRSPADRQRALALLSGEEPPPPTRSVTVREVFLKESTLTPRGAVHRTVRAFPLGGRPADAS